MATGMVAALKCAECGSPSTRVELVAPGQMPAEWDHCSEERRQTFQRRRDRDPGKWYLLFEGVAAGNGWGGDAIEPDTAERIAEAFREPCTYAQVHTAGFYDDAGFCELCDAAYCYRHWNVSATGYGHCPRSHGKSLDPHW
jgi:hypothetical protein